MDVVCFYREFIVPVSIDRAFKGLVIDAHKLLPKVLPHIVKSSSYIHGDGGPGSVKETIFTEESGLGSQLVRVDVLDPTNYSHKLTYIEGGSMFGKMDAVVYEVKYEALGRDKCICKLATEYHPEEGFPFKKEDAQAGRLVII